VLPADTVCWHCGYQLPRRPKQRPEAAARRGRSSRPGSSDDTAELQPADLRAVAVYGLLTLLVIIALIAVMHALSRRPVLVRSAGLDLGGGWVAVTDEALRYTVSLPAGWQWFDLGSSDQAELLDRLAERQPYIRRATRPLGEAAGDAVILAVAVAAESGEVEEAQPQPLLVVERSERMRGLTPEEALERLAAQPLPVAEQSIDARLAGQRQARFDVVDEPHAYHCRHLFVADETAAYLVAACAPPTRYRALGSTLNDILNSFQLLQH